jgi:apolipoprotein N-acyltransferase
VPLFERMPFVQYLGFLGKYSLELGGYTGTYSLRQERTTFVLPDASVTVLPIVCFESIFGPYCSRNLPKDAGFICMITNDGWWKNTPGYRHHFNFSPVRAIENRRDFVRRRPGGRKRPSKEKFIFAGGKLFSPGMEIFWAGYRWCWGDFWFCTQGFES